MELRTERLKEEELKIETVCLLSKLHEAKHHVNVRLDMDELDLTSAESKATYEERKEKLWKSIYGCSKNYIFY